VTAKATLLNATSSITSSKSIFIINSNFRIVETVEISTEVFPLSVITALVRGWHTLDKPTLVVLANTAVVQGKHPDAVLLARGADNDNIITIIIGISKMMVISVTAADGGWSPITTPCCSSVDVKSPRRGSCDRSSTAKMFFFFFFVLYKAFWPLHSLLSCVRIFAGASLLFHHDFAFSAVIHLLRSLPLGRTVLCVVTLALLQ
jgi:hypothetical protein